MLTVHVFVFDGYWDWQPPYACAQLDHGFRVLTVAASLQPVVTAGGVRILPDRSLNTLLASASALLILPGGTAWDIGANREAVRKAAQFLDAGIPVAALSGAALALVREGLDGHPKLIAAPGGTTPEFARAILSVWRAAPPKQDQLQALVWSDPPGLTDSPASRKTIVSIHMGASVQIGCRRGGQYHCGTSVHGDIDVIPAGMTSRWELKEKDTAFIIRVPMSFLHQAADESSVDPLRVEIVNRFQMRDPQMEHIGWALKNEMESGYPSGRLYMDSLGTAMAACLIDRHSSASRATRMYSQAMSGRRLRQVLSHIEDNLGRELSLKEIAQVAGISVSHCNAAFRRAVGIPVHQYVIQRRVERAKTLLREGHLSISQIAAETGFAHQSHLAYHFRRLLGLSPLKLRENHGRLSASSGPLIE